ncbi:hypothetical protein FJZ48_03555 [Candidatus Uhrbacteria bacterium]|nr:hypothetical protein [Candidatus Uhrbacteria bacterium]
MKRLLVFEPKTSLQRRQPGEVVRDHFKIRRDVHIRPLISSKAGLYAEIRGIESRAPTVLMIDLRIDTEVLTILKRLLNHRFEQVTVISLRPIPDPIEVPERASPRNISDIKQFNSALAELNTFLKPPGSESRPTESTTIAA